MVRINGKKEDADGMVLQEYLVRNGYPPAGIAVECNEEMVAKSRYAEYILKDGDVVESGNHQELLAKGGFYATLYNSQFESASA